MYFQTANKGIKEHKTQTNNDIEKNPYHLTLHLFLRKALFIIFY